jgi:hypothetical protein
VLAAVRRKREENELVTSAIIGLIKYEKGSSARSLRSALDVGQINTHDNHERYTSLLPKLALFHSLLLTHSLSTMLRCVLAAMMRFRYEGRKGTMSLLEESDLMSRNQSLFNVNNARKEILILNDAHLSMPDTPLYLYRDAT